jgi:hypothetical protein
LSAAVDSISGTMDTNDIGFSSESGRTTTTQVRGSDMREKCFGAG